MFSKVVLKTTFLVNDHCIKDDDDNFLILLKKHLNNSETVGASEMILQFVFISHVL